MTGHRLKVVTVVGTRPEIIRLSETIKLLDNHADQILVHTGQNWDYELNEIFFKDLGVRKPDHFLNTERGRLGAMIGSLMTEIEKVFDAVAPDALLILGDTNSALCSILAKRRKITIFHMEAGNRCFDFNVPEEVNRRIVDHISDYNLVYTEHARRNLLAEGLPTRQIYLTGSPLNEVLAAHRTAIENSQILDGLSLAPGGFILASLHREENVDPPQNLAALLRALDLVASHFAVPVVVSTHPRTRQRLEALGAQTEDGNLIFHKPFGFLDYCKLQKSALCVISDSGTISEESLMLGFPAITPRLAMERPEAIDAGAVIHCGLTPEAILGAAQCSVQMYANGGFRHVPPEYQVANTAERVVKLIIGATSPSPR